MVFALPRNATQININIRYQMYKNLPSRYRFFYRLQSREIASRVRKVLDWNDYVRYVRQVYMALSSHLFY